MALCILQIVEKYSAFCAGSYENMLLVTIFEEHCDSLKRIFRLLYNEKRVVHNIAVQGKKSYAERKNKEKLHDTDFKEVMLVYSLKEDDGMMRIDGFNGGNTQAGTMGVAQMNDPVSKNIQNQIAKAQQKLRDISSNEEMSLEDKMKKRQEIQQEIMNLNQQLRQHQIEQRRELQSKSSSSMDDMIADTKKTSSKKDTGLSQTGVKAMISADSSVKQAKAQGGVAMQMKGRAAVLESEIKQDAGKGNTEQREAELAAMQEKAQAATKAQMSTLADADKSMEEAVKAENRTGAVNAENDKIQKEQTDKPQKEQRMGLKNTDKTQEEQGTVLENTDRTGDTESTVEPQNAEKTYSESGHMEIRQPMHMPIDIRL